MKCIKFGFSFTLLLSIFLIYPFTSNASEYNRNTHDRMIEQFVWSKGQLTRMIFRYDGNGNLIGKSQHEIGSNVYYPIETSYSNGSYNIMVGGLETSVSKVSFPTWTDNKGQDDLFWYQGENLGNGIWKVTIPFNRHGNEQGKYITHIYVDDHIYAETETNVMSTTSLHIPSEINLAEESYDVYIDGVGEDVTAVRFPTWTEANGQDDLKWYEGSKISEGTWRATIPFKEHQYEKGTYITHVYSLNQYGDTVAIGGGTTKAIPGVKASQEVSLSSASYTVIAGGVDSDVDRVIFPTWTAQNEQDDIVWYEGEQIGQGVWRAVIPFSKHAYEKGEYVTHIYDKTHNSFLGATSTWVKETSSVRIAPQVSLVDGSYDIYVDGVSEDVTTVRFPTWTHHNGQDDLEWKEGHKVSDGTWAAAIRFSDHNQETGAYTTHVYSYDPFGHSVMLGIGDTTAIAGVKAPTAVNYYAGFYEVLAYGIDPEVTQVRFPTWTEANDQDDIIWYEGEKVDRGVWKIRVLLNEHNYETGKYITHIYVNGAYWGANVSVVER